MSPICWGFGVRMKASKPEPPASHNHGGSVCPTPSREDRAGSPLGDGIISLPETPRSINPLGWGGGLLTAGRWGGCCHVPRRCPHVPSWPSLGPSGCGDVGRIWPGRCGCQGGHCVFPPPSLPPFSPLWVRAHPGEGGCGSHPAVVLGRGGILTKEGGGLGSPQAGWVQKSAFCSWC